MAFILPCPVRFAGSTPSPAMPGRKYATFKTNNKTMSKTPDATVLFYFLTYCAARKKGHRELEDAMLNAIHDHGFDVETQANGNWALVQKEDNFEQERK